RYRGPTLDDCLFSATWATETMKVPGSKKLAHKIRDQFAAEWLWVEDLNAFVNRRQVNHLRSKEAFNSRVPAFSDVEDTARLLVRRRREQCERVDYMPGERPGVVNVGGERVVNTCRPASVKGMIGDAKPFCDFMRYLIPDKKDRREAMRWITTEVVKIEVRM